MHKEQTPDIETYECKCDKPLNYIQEDYCEHCLKPIPFSKIPIQKGDDKCPKLQYNLAIPANCVTTDGVISGIVP